MFKDVWILCCDCDDLYSMLSTDAPAFHSSASSNQPLRTPWAAADSFASCSCSPRGMNRDCCG